MEVIHLALESFIPKVVEKHQYSIWFNDKIKHELNHLHTLRRKCRLRLTTNNKVKLLTADNNL